ncbi:MAG TPA: GapR family DNA-binding domain-containing protein [Pseudolabrys sp.]
MNTIDGRKLLNYIERVEALNRDIKAAKDDIKSVVVDAARDGFSPKGIQFCVKVRSQKPREFEENEQLRDMYLHAIGMADTPPLFRALDAFAGQQLGRDELIEKFKELVPSKGEITLKLEGAAPMRLWRDKDGNPHAEEVKAPKPSAKAPAQSGPAHQAPDVPDVDGDGAMELGRAAARENKAIISNPFPFGDNRRPRFDEGWRKETGNDGFGPE